MFVRLVLTSWCGWRCLADCFQPCSVLFLFVRISVLCACTLVCVWSEKGHKSCWWSECLVYCCHCSNSFWHLSASVSDHQRWHMVPGCKWLAVICIIMCPGSLEWCGIQSAVHCCCGGLLPWMYTNISLFIFAVRLSSDLPRVDIVCGCVWGCTGICCSAGIWQLQHLNTAALGTRRLCSRICVELLQLQLCVLSMSTYGLQLCPPRSMLTCAKDCAADIIMLDAVMLMCLFLSVCGTCVWDIEHHW